MTGAPEGVLCCPQPQAAEGELEEGVALGQAARDHCKRKVKQTARLGRLRLATWILAAVKTTGGWAVTPGGGRGQGEITWGSPGPGQLGTGTAEQAASY